MAAEGGDARAQNSLAVILAQGCPPEVPADSLGAVMWFQRSSAQVWQGLQCRAGVGLLVIATTVPASTAGMQFLHTTVCTLSSSSAVSLALQAGLPTPLRTFQLLSGVPDASHDVRGCPHRLLLVLHTPLGELCCQGSHLAAPCCRAMQLP